MNCQVLPETNALNIIWMNDRYQTGFSCVIPRGIYAPKRGIPCHFPMTDVNVLMIILVKDREQ